MATQAESSPPAPSAQVIGNAFVEQYYHILHHSPEFVHRFYQDASVLSRPDPAGVMSTVSTLKNINDKICSLDYKDYKAEIKTADAQDSYKEGVVVLVTGCLTGKDNLRRKFTQSFFLAPQDKGYYVLNDVFRYVEESEPNITTDEAVVVEEIQTNSSTQSPESAQVVDPPNANFAVEYVEPIQEKANDQVIDETQVSADRDIVVETEPHLNDNHLSSITESVTSSSLEDTPKKSYASIVSSQTKKGPTRIYVPANTAKIAKAASVKTVKPPANSAGESAVSEASAPAAPVNTSENKDIPEEVEGHSIYVRNLPLDISVTEIEAVFNKFGPIKPHGVQVRSNKQQEFCFGFVEFQDFSSMQSAIKASPITIGDYQATMEIKRTKTRVGSGRSRFINSRGGFRNDNFRGRGNFGSGGRTYTRNDSFRGRGNFSGGRSIGEDYQPVRGRGGGRRSGGPTQNSTST